MKVQTGISRLFRLNLANLAYVFGENRSDFLKAALLSLACNSILSVANPLAIKYLFDEGIIKGNFAHFLLLSLCFVSFFTLYRFLGFWNQMFLARLKSRAVQSTCLLNLERYYGLDYQETRAHTTGYFVSRVYDEVADTVTPLVDSTMVIFNGSVSAVIALVLTLVLSRKAFVFTLAVTPVVLYLSKRFGSRIKKQSIDEKEEEARLRGLLGGAIESYKAVRVFDLWKPVQLKANDQLNKFRSTSYLRLRASTLYRTLTATCTSCAESALVVLGGYQILKGQLSFGSFMALINSYWIVIGSLKALSDQLPELSKGLALAERIASFGKRQSRPLMDRSEGEGEASLDGIFFAYPEGIVLRDFSLKVVPGERIVVVGANGAGKSTLALILGRFLRPEAGVCALPPFSRISSIVLPFGFIPGTVRDNVNLYQGCAREDERLLTLARELEIERLLESDPRELSAGQRGRVEVLMALHKNADLYILDEPLSHIDEESKEGVLRTILGHTEGKILVVIMHGDEQLRSLFDRVVTMERYAPRACQPSKEGFRAPENVLPAVFATTGQASAAERN